MKYALLDNERIEPQKGIKNAVCPCCKELVVPVCGDKRIHHWRHKTKINCDPWWENETEWHRQWKDNFPKECQEIVMHDETTGEKHIADVKTKSGIVIEFQHSPINPEEQHSREQFYKNMIWVVDANNYFDLFKYMVNNKYFKRYKKTNYFYYEDSHNFYDNNWINSNVPVIFDFGINETASQKNRLKNGLWCIFPQKLLNFYIGLYITKQDFIDQVTNNKIFVNKNILSEIEPKLLEIIKKRNEEKHRKEEEFKKQLLEQKKIEKEQQIEERKKEFELSRKRTEEKNKKKKIAKIYEQNYENFKNNLNNKNITPLYLKIIQKNSKELKNNPLLKVGDIYSNITNNTYNNSDIVICGFKINYLEYSDKKREKILNIYDENDNIIKTAKNVTKQYKGHKYTELQTTKGTILDKRFKLLIIIQNEFDIQPAIISLPNKLGECIVNRFYSDANKHILYNIDTHCENNYFKFNLKECYNKECSDNEIITIIEQLKILSGSILYKDD